jgi:unsaturated chondroitin disaccharide hydrolase
MQPRSTLTLLIAALALLAPAVAHAQAPRLDAVVEDFAGPLDGFREEGVVRSRAYRAGSERGLRIAAGPGSLRRAFPWQPWSLSLDLRLEPGSELTLGVGPGATGRLRLSRGVGEDLEAKAGRRRARLGVRRGWAEDGWRHLELAGADRPVLAVDGRRLRLPLSPGGGLSMKVTRGAADVAALVATPADDRRALLLHRLAELHARVPLGRYPLGTGTDGKFRLGSGWTTGFWPGALWQAADLTGGGGLFRRWALARTLRHRGREKVQIHDLGFMYGRSSDAALKRVCEPRRTSPTKCVRLRRSVERAADTLVYLASTNAPAGMIPTYGPRTLCHGCASRAEAQTIVDSMMNLGLLIRASELTGDGRYREVAARHAAQVAQLLVREDGSTIAALRARRSDGAILWRGTRQGLSDDSTWARGQAWALYGFADVAAGLGDRALLEVAERAARYVAAQLPAAGVPPWDYDAPEPAPIDTSAGVITAAGLFRLDEACRRVAGGCADAARWRPLGERILEASLRSVRATPPLGFLGSQVYTLRGRHAWDDSGEFIFGLDYALEAVRLSPAVSGG